MMADKEDNGVTVVSDKKVRSGSTSTGGGELELNGAYHSPGDANQEKEIDKRETEFIEVGCGNGVLTYVLNDHWFYGGRPVVFPTPQPALSLDNQNNGNGYIYNAGLYNKIQAIKHNTS